MSSIDEYFKTTRKREDIIILHKEGSPVEVFKILLEMPAISSGFRFQNNPCFVSFLQKSTGEFVADNTLKVEIDDRGKTRVSSDFTLKNILTEGYRVLPLEGYEEIYLYYLPED